MHPPLPNPNSLLAHETHVRAMARALLADENAVDDVAQETWLAHLEQGPRETGRLRAWLGAVARNLSVDAIRRGSRRRARERLSSRDERIPSAAEIVQREEARHRIVTALSSLEEPYRTALLLRFFEGLPPRVIGAQMGVPTETARTRVKRGLELLRLRLDRQYGNRGAWSVALLPLASAPWMPLGLTQVTSTLQHSAGPALVMATKTKVLTVVSALLLVMSLTLWYGASEGSPPPETGPSSSAATVPVQRAAAEPRTAAVKVPDSDSSTREEERSSSVPAASLPSANDPYGALVIHAVWKDDKTPAAGVGARFIARGEPNGTLNPPLHTFDKTGTVRLERVYAGSVWVRFDRWIGKNVRVKPGETIESTIEIPPGYTIEGNVVDASGAPVENAEIFLDEQNQTGIVATRSGKDGAFAIRGIGERLAYSVSARAVGFAPSLQHEISSKAGAVVRVKLVLPGPGGELEGLVLDPEEKPVAHAIVWVGSRERQQLALGDGSHGASPLVQKTLTDSLGRFRAVSLTPGSIPVAVRAPGFAVWKQDVQIMTDPAAHVAVNLQPGTSLVGTVRDELGEPVAGIDVRVGGAFTIDGHSVATSGDGSFRLTGLPANEFSVHAASEKKGRASATLRGAPGGELRWDPMLSTGMKISGRVLDEAGNSLAEAWVSIMPMPSVRGVQYQEFAFTDAQGRFTLQNLSDVAHRVEAGPKSGGKYGLTFLDNVKPEGKELVITIKNSDAPTAFLEGCVVDTKGQPISAELLVASPQLDHASMELNDPKTGRFKIGPVPSGRYQVSVMVKGAATRRVAPRDVKSGETADFGTLRMEAGGFVSVSSRLEDSGLKPFFVITDADGWVVGHATSEPNASGVPSESTPTGHYWLQAYGADVDSTRIPIDVHAGETTRVAISVKCGISRTIRILKRKDSAMGQESLRLIVKSNAGEVVYARMQLWESSAPHFETRVALAPGNYRFAADSGGARAEGAFRVESSESAEPVVATLD